MAMSKALITSSPSHFSLKHSPPLFYSSSSSSSSSSLHSSCFLKLCKRKQALLLSPCLLFSTSLRKKSKQQLCRAVAEYQFPDPIPDFAEAETEKFKNHLLEKLPKKEIYGGSVQDVVGICTEIFSTFLHTEYGGPGTLLVVPFIDMADTINERGLPGGPQAARAAVVWAQKHVDKDWNEWTGDEDNK